MMTFNRYDRSTFYITLFDKLAIQLSIPSVGNNGLGYYLTMKTHVQAGKAGLALTVLGFGVAIVLRKFMPPQTEWMWNLWRGKKDGN